jgi:hypothetical protein
MLESELRALCFLFGGGSSVEASVGGMNPSAVGDRMGLLVGLRVGDRMGLLV